MAGQNGNFGQETKYAAPNKPGEKAKKEKRGKIVEKHFQKHAGGEIYKIPEEVMDVDTGEPEAESAPSQERGENSRNEEQTSQNTMKEPELGQQRITWPQKVTPRVRMNCACSFGGTEGKRSWGRWRGR